MPGKYMKRDRAASEQMDSKKEEIRKVAYCLFLEKGYSNTSMREIAGKAGVSLGLITYHFKNKKDIAFDLLYVKFEQLTHIVHRYVEQEKDPLLYSAVLVRLNYTVFSSARFYLFYRDSLKEDIFFDVIAKSGIDTYMMICKKYRPDISKEEAKRMGWYANYISASMERALVLFGHEQNFVQEQIPESIFRSYIEMWSFEQKEQILEECCTKGQQIVKKICEEHPEIFEAQSKI